MLRLIKNKIQELRGNPFLCLQFLINFFSFSHACISLLNPYIKMTHTHSLFRQIKNLMIERIKEVNAVENEANKSFHWKAFHGIRNGLSQMAIMFQAPHLKNAFVVFFIQFCILFG